MSWSGDSGILLNRLKAAGINPWTGEPVATFTVDEIRRWLEGWRTFDGDGERVGALPLESVLALLEDPEDGIVACRGRE